MRAEGQAGAGAAAARGAQKGTGDSIRIVRVSGCEGVWADACWTGQLMLRIPAIAKAIKSAEMPASFKSNQYNNVSLQIMDALCRITLGSFLDRTMTITLI
jgi:hypothetical protein